jgi:hypothetical protein
MYGPGVGRAFYGYFMQETPVIRTIRQISHVSNDMNGQCVVERVSPVCIGERQLRNNHCQCTGILVGLSLSSTRELVGPGTAWIRPRKAAIEPIFVEVLVVGDSRRVTVELNLKPSQYRRVTELCPALK